MAQFISKSVNVKTTEVTLYSTLSPTVLTKPSIITHCLVVNSSENLDLKIDIWKEIQSSPGVKIYLAQDLVVLKSPPIPYELPVKSSVLMPGESLKAIAYDSGSGPLFDSADASWQLFNWNDFVWDDIEASLGQPGSMDVILSIYES